MQKFDGERTECFACVTEADSRVKRRRQRRRLDTGSSRSSLPEVRKRGGTSTVIYRVGRQSFFRLYLHFLSFFDGKDVLVNLDYDGATITTMASRNRESTAVGHLPLSTTTISFFFS